MHGLTDTDNVPVIVIEIPGQQPIVVIGNQEEEVADEAVEMIRRHCGARLVDPEWRAAHPYPRSRGGQATGWLDRLADAAGIGDPVVTRVGTATLVIATIRRPDVAAQTEWQPYKGVIIRRSVYTDGTLLAYRMWDRSSQITGRYSTEAALRRKLAALAHELGSPRPEEWGPTHQKWREDPDDRS